MRTRVRTLTRAVAAVFGATVIALGAASMIDQFGDVGAIASAYAKDEGGASGGHTSGSSGSAGGHSAGGSEKSGGHSTGGGSDKGGGHSGDSGGDKGGGHATGSGHSGGSDKGGGPNTASHRYGLERGEHGTKPGHQGHASGTHGQNAKHGATAHDTGASRRFGGGSGLAGLEQVLEGPARFGGGTTLTQSASTDPGPKFRFRYWGGWTIPDDGAPTDDVEVATVEFTPTGAGGGPLAKLSLPSAARCDDVGAGMRTKAFYSAANLARLDAARAELDPGLLAAGRGLDPTLMVNVQEDLVDGRVDSLVIGSYFGMMATSPVTPEAVKRVAYRLCAPVTDETAKRIAQVAEEMRVVARAE